MQEKKEMAKQVNFSKGENATKYCGAQAEAGPLKDPKRLPRCGKMWAGSGRTSGLLPLRRRGRGRMSDTVHCPSITCVPFIPMNAYPLGWLCSQSLVIIAIGLSQS